jgi:diaminopropionate ammonia-lyase
MLDESDEQVIERTGGVPTTHAIVPVGVGSIAQAVTQHFKSSERSTCPAKVITVEPDTAASLKTSLEAGKIITVPTEDSIMCGMNCGTVSTTAWPVLRAGVDASILVTDIEAHQAVLDLKVLGIHAGPCGASTLAALRRAVSVKREELGLDRSSVVVLFCTEGAREYETPI